MFNEDDVKQIESRGSSVAAIDRLSVLKRVFRG